MLILTMLNIPFGRALFQNTAFIYMNAYYFNFSLGHIHTFALPIYVIYGKHILCWSQPISNQCCSWISPCGSYFDCKMPFSRKKQRKQRFITSKTWELKSTPGSHREVAGRERGRTCGLGVLFFY